MGPTAGGIHVGGGHSTAGSSCKVKSFEIVIIAVGECNYIFETINIQVMS